MSAPLDNAIELRVPSKPEYVAIVRTLISDVARRVALPASAVEDVQVAASEACANVVRHAYEEPDESDILVRCSSSLDSLVIEIEDQGCGLDKPCRRSGERNGFGLILIHNLMDDVSLDTEPDRGTVVRMVKNIGHCAGPNVRG